MLAGADHAQGVGFTGCVTFAGMGQMELGVLRETPEKEPSGRGARRSGAAARVRGGGGGWRAKAKGVAAAITHSASASRPIEEKNSLYVTVTAGPRRSVGKTVRVVRSVGLLQARCHHTAAAVVAAAATTRRAFSAPRRPRTMMVRCSLLPSLLSTLPVSTPRPFPTLRSPQGFAARRVCRAGPGGHLKAGGV